jgi:hypothetical protein
VFSEDCSKNTHITSVWVLIDYFSVLVYLHHAKRAQKIARNRNKGNERRGEVKGE